MKPRFRREMKFLVHHSVKELLLERWRRYLRPAPFTNEHAVTPILSQYYDSPHLLFYHEKLAGFGMRQKLRIRTYGQKFEPGATTFIEIKHRYDDLVRKHRYRIPNFELRHLDPESWSSFEDEGIRRAASDLRERYLLRPAAQVYYQREAYEGAVEGDIRVTFDTCLLGLHPRERLAREFLYDPRRRLLPDSLAILEVKATREVMPPWVHEGIVAGELQQQTIPKYITAVEGLGLLELSEAGIYG